MGLLRRRKRNGYVGDLDQYCHDFDQEHKKTDSQRHEQSKHRRVHQQRDYVVTNGDLETDEWDTED